MFNDINWSLIGLCKQYLINKFKNNNMARPNWTRQSDRIWKHTLHSTWVCCCTQTWLDAFISLAIFWYPTEAQEQYVCRRVHRGFRPSFYAPQTQNYNQSDTLAFGCMWSSGWEQLMNWLTRRIWETSASELGWITFPLLLECRCISVRGWQLMLRNCGTDSWPWLQISSPLPQVSDTLWRKITACTCNERTLE